MSKEYQNIFLDSNVKNFHWSGKNRIGHRRYAGRQLADFISKYRELHPNEKINVVAHSHGGNVPLEAIRRGASIDNLVTIGTPVRWEHRGDRENIGMWYNVYSPADQVQNHGGGWFELFGQETGPAGRKFPEADVNIKLYMNTGPIKTHSDILRRSSEPVYRAKEYIESENIKLRETYY